MERSAVAPTVGRRIPPPPRRYVVIVVSALATFAAADYLVRRAEPTLRAYDVADYERKPSALAAGPLPDILLIGSSRAKYALVPEEFRRRTGADAYNLGIAGSKTAEWELIVRRLLAKRRPMLVVLGVNASEFRADYVPTPAARNLFDLPDFIDSLRLEGPSMEVAVHYLGRVAAPVWAAFHRRYEIRMFAQERLAALLPKHAQASRELRERVATPPAPDGYDHPWQRGRQLRNLAERLLADPAAVDAASVPIFEPDAPAFRRFDRLLGWLNERGVATVVAYLPNSPTTQRRWAGVEPRFVAAIEDVCRRRGVRFIDCNLREAPRTDAEYLEEIHVGLPLARRISRRIADRVVAYGLVERRARQVARGVAEDDDLP